VGALLPDYRGVFLRGHGSVTSGHYGTVVHQSGDIGELQGDTIRNVSGQIGNISHGKYVPSYASGAFTRRYSSDVGNAISTGSTEEFTLDASRVVPTSNENRPVNRAVVYLVRAR
jgi:hypothetical protein